MGFIQNFFMRRFLKKAASSSGLETSSDAILASAIKEMTETGKTARKLLQAKMLRQESKKTLDDIASLGEDEYEEEDNSDGDMGLLDILKLLPSQQQKQETDPYADQAAPQSPAPAKKLDVGGLLEMAKTLTPEQKKKLNKMFDLKL